MTLREYFKLPSSPMENSPVGRLMARILADSPQMAFEEVLKEAQRLLNEGARRKHYKFYTLKQDIANKAKGQTMASRLHPTPRNAKNEALS